MLAIAIVTILLLLYLLFGTNKEGFRINDSYPPKGDGTGLMDYSDNPAPIEGPNVEQDKITLSAVQDTPSFTTSGGGPVGVQEDFNNFGMERDYKNRFVRLDRVYKMKDTDYNRMKKLEETDPSPNYPIPRVSGILLRDDERANDIVQGFGDENEVQNAAAAERVGSVVIPLPTDPIVSNNMV